MDRSGLFFTEVLVFQLVFTIAVTALVARRFPRRLAAYRLIVPAAVPLMMLVLAVFSYTMVMQALGRPAEIGPVARMLISYAVLWLVGVLVADLVIGRMRR